MAEFVKIGGITRIDRLTDGSVMCCICFHYFQEKDLAVVLPECTQKWDVCKQCNWEEMIYMRPALTEKSE